MWGRRRQQIGEYCKEYISLWGQAGEDLSLLEVSHEFLEHTLPKIFTEHGYTRIGALPDGKDFMIDTARTNSMVSRAMRSDKVKNSAVRCISWMTPANLSFEHTDLFLARCSEKKLVDLWGKRFKNFPAGWDMLADRGFAGTERSYPNMNRQRTPNFLKKRKQFAEGEVMIDMVLCKLRYTCEVGFARVTSMKSLKDRISFWFFNDLDSINHWGHAMVNLMKPLI